jgi:MoxR-like ATPase
LQEGLYRYDAIARLQDASLQKDKTPPDIGKYLKLGPLGTAFAAGEKPRVLLIDEIDKSDIDLPNDLLHIFEEGEFEIPELARLPKDQQKVSIRAHGDDTQLFEITSGQVRCQAFPLVIMTSNGEKDFPAPFLRRCLQLDMKLPNEKQLKEIVEAHLGKVIDDKVLDQLISKFVNEREQEDLANDQLLNAAYLVLKSINVLEREKLREALWKSLSVK